MMKHLIVGLTGLLALATTTSVYADNVEFALKHNLDGYLNGYCLDISGGGKNIDPANGLQVHTCYSYKGALGSDQIFTTEKLSEDKLYMPEFNVCAQVTEAIEGAQVTLPNCDQNKLQQISLLGDGTIRPLADESLCFTASLSTRQGLQGTSNHQIKDLTLQKCSPDRAIFQQWFTRTGI